MPISYCNFLQPSSIRLETPAGQAITSAAKATLIAALISIQCIVAAHAAETATSTVPSLGPSVGPAIRSIDTMAERVAACVACHGKEGRATRDGYFPRIAGKPAGYLYNQLVNFREGRRKYPLMNAMVAHMSDAYLEEIAQYFANQHLPYPPAQRPAFSQSTLEHGRRLVMQGDASRNIPACISCHGNNLTGATPNIPGLVGLPRDYLNAQFGAWKSGARHATAPDCMAQISRELQPADIQAVSAWLASQPVPNDMTPVSSVTMKMPLACGSAS